MTNEKLNTIVNNPGYYLKPDRSGKGYICPICNSGTGKNGTGLTSKDGIHFTCWRGCFSNKDILDIIGQEYGITDFKEKVKKACDIYGIEDDNHVKGNSAIKKTRSAATPQPKKASELKEVEEINLKKEVEISSKNLLNHEEALEHFKKRGISVPVLRDHSVGYDEKGINHFLKDHPENQTKATKAYCYKYFFPCLDDKGNYTSVIAEINNRDNVDTYHPKYRKISGTGTTTKLYNERYISASRRVVFITEGVYDALSVEEAGKSAIALLGVSHNRLISLVKEYKPDTVFVVSLDQDDAGEKAAKRIAEEFDGLGVAYIIKPAAQEKDLNEFLQKDRIQFFQFIEEAEKEALAKKEEIAQAQKEKEEQERKEYIKSSASGFLPEFMKEVYSRKEGRYIPTGFRKLDLKLDGGLYPGLYVFGAISSLGKTTLVTQIIDQAAEAGHDVLLFSLEMSKSQIIAKSLSRLTYCHCIESKKNIKMAKTVRALTNGKLYDLFSREELQVIDAAFSRYKEYAEHIFIKEGIGDIGVPQIVDEVVKHERITGNKPIVVVDYLQILAPYDVRATDKQNIDKSVLELKRLSRDHDIPVIGISSLNRANYSTEINMAAFKESGAIEYTTDVLIGLQFKGAGNAGFDANKEKTKIPREIELMILKNRNGETGSKIEYEYHPAFNVFREVEDVGRRMDTGRNKIGDIN